MPNGYFALQKTDSGHTISVLNSNFQLTMGVIAQTLNNFAHPGYPTQFEAKSPKTRDPAIASWNFCHTGLLPIEDVVSILENSCDLIQVDKPALLDKKAMAFEGSLQTAA